MIIIPRHINVYVSKATKHIPSIFAVTLFTLAVIMSFAYHSVSKSNMMDDKTPINVGLVIEDDHKELDAGVALVKEMDTAVKFTEMTEEDAISMLKAGEISGYVKLPKGFLRSVINGKNNNPAIYTIRDGSVNFGAIMSSEVANTISRYVVETQRSVYGITSIGSEYEADSIVRKQLGNYNKKHFQLVFSRNDTCEVVYVGVKDKVSFGAYYVLGMLMLFFMMWGISCFNFLCKKDTSMSKFMKARGIGSISQVLNEYIAYTLVTLGTMLLFGVIIGVVTLFVNINITEFQGIGMHFILTYIVKLLPVLMMVCALHLLIYECMTNMIGAILLQFVLAIAMGYVSGLLYPNFFFPESVQIMADYLPCGVGFSYMRKLLKGLSIHRDLLVMLLYSGVFISMTAAVRKYRMGVDR